MYIYTHKHLIYIVYIRSIYSVCTVYIHEYMCVYTFYIYVCVYKYIYIYIYTLYIYCKYIRTYVLCLVTSDSL